MSRRLPEMLTWLRGSVQPHVLEDAALYKTVCAQCTQSMRTCWLIRQVVALNVLQRTAPLWIIHQLLCGGTFCPESDSCQPRFILRLEYNPSLVIPYQMGEVKWEAVPVQAKGKKKSMKLSVIFSVACAHVCMCSWDSVFFYGAKIPHRQFRNISS